MTGRGQQHSPTFSQLFWMGILMTCDCNRSRLRCLSGHEISVQKMSVNVVGRDRSHVWHIQESKLERFIRKKSDVRVVFTTFITQFCKCCGYWWNMCLMNWIVLEVMHVMILHCFHSIAACCCWCIGWTSKYCVNYAFSFVNSCVSPVKQHWLTSDSPSNLPSDSSMIH